MWPFTGKSKEPKQINAKFDLAQTTADNRKHWASADGLSSRAATSHAVRRVVRMRSRYEAENNSWYAGMLRTAANHIVGNGPRLQLLTPDPEANARVEKAWRLWAAKADLPEMLRTLVKTYWQDGEVFLMRADRQSLWPNVTLDLRTFEADQISSPWNQAYDDPYIDDGIRFDRSTNEIEYYVYDHHPGSNTPLSTLNGKWYSARDVLHLFRVERPGQVHGIPRATASLQTLPIMRRQELATLFSAETAANFAMFLESNSPSLDPSSSPADFAEIEITRNMLTTLPAGWKIGQVKPEQPTSTYNSFQSQALKSFCRCTNMPYGIAAGTFQESNFSAAKADMRMLWQPEVQSEQSRLECSILSGVFVWWLEAAIYVPGLLAGLPPINQIDHVWHHPPIPSLDPIDDANAATARLSSGQTSLTEEYATRGKDFATGIQRAADDYGVPIDALKAAIFAKTFGLVPGAPMPAAPGVTAQPAALPQGEYTQLGQRAFTNNQKRIKSSLEQLASGLISQVMTEQTLASIGLAPDRIAALIADALDGGIDDAALHEVPV